MIFSLIVCFSGTSQATEAKKLFNFQSVLESYEKTLNNTFHWNADYRASAAPQTVVLKVSKGNSFGERIAAIGLGIIMEYTTNNTYNELVVQ